MKEKQAAVLECLAHIAYETQPGIVLETVAAALRAVLDAEEVCFYEWHGSWLPLWPQESAQPLPLQGALLLHERGEAFFQDDGWNGMLALPGVQQAEGAVPGLPQLDLRRLGRCPLVKPLQFSILLSSSSLEGAQSLRSTQVAAKPSLFSAAASIAK